MKLAGKTAIVTGSGHGIGRETAIRFAREGAKVVVVDINMEFAEKAAAEITATGALAIAVQADVRSSKEINRMAEVAFEQFGAIDILVNCAGGFAGAINRYSLFVDSDEEVWDWVFDVNLKGTFICTKAVIHHMIERGSGKIVNVASIAGVVGIKKMVDYSAAKGGIIAFTKALAMEVGTSGVNVNCVSPGLTERSPNSSHKSNGTYLGRSGNPEEIANLIAFLASDEADYITGQNYIIDGGRWLGPKGTV